MTADRAIGMAAFRRILGQFATGVTVITVQHDGRTHGMTANTFTSVSLDPPLVLFCVARTARMTAFVVDAEGFAVNILADNQQEASRHFAGSRKDEAPSAVRLHPGPVAPLLEGSLASLSCATEAVYEGGDHLIVLGRVIELHEGTRASPLVFFRSRYCDVLEGEMAPVEPGELWSNDAIQVYHAEWTEGDDSSFADEPLAPW
ncbi:MAG TPA: flavin reductase family protein [Thermomicrobiales bacterium]|nr:flavin reductase family protein [Thermomicrobiales bacterium]